MRVFVVESAKTDRGQSQSLMQENYNCCLFSYAYRQQTLYAPNAYFPFVLNHFALTTPQSRLLIDSGAFTAWSTGKIIRVEEYAEWAHSFRAEWEPKTTSLDFMNLDVIGDQEKSWVNQRTLESLGMKPIPIFTYGAGFEHLDRALENYDYIALGGLVPYMKYPKKLRSWLDACFSRVLAYRTKTGVMRRIHLLGISTAWIFFRYPCYSSDSTSWLSCFFFGRAESAGLKNLPFYDRSVTHRTVTGHVIRTNIKNIKKLCQTATDLWRSRGIYWDETL
jgi:hypothetical protein